MVLNILIITLILIYFQISESMSINNTNSKLDAAGNCDAVKNTSVIVAEPSIPKKSFINDNTLLTGGAIISTATVGGYGLVCLGSYLIGLSSVGPVAGGWFATHMGSSLATGSVLSTLQSGVMTGTAYSWGGTIGFISGLSGRVGYRVATQQNDDSQKK